MGLSYACVRAHTHIREGKRRSHPLRSSQAQSFQWVTSGRIERRSSQWEDEGRSSVVVLGGVRGVKTIELIASGCQSNV